MTSPAGTTSYTYDAAGRLVSLTNPYSETTSYSYDHIGRLTNQSTSTGQATIATAYTWGVSGLAGDPNTKPVYLRQITQTVNGNVFRQYTLKHSYLGQLLQRTGTGPNYSETSTYGYDGRGRLTSESINATVNGTPYSKTGSFSFDAANNIQGGAGGWTYNDNNQLTNAPALGGLSGATGLSYDAAGNLLTLNGMNFTWDVFGNLSQVTNTPQGTVTYQTNSLGQRVTKTVGGATTYYVYDGDDLICELDPNGVIKTSFTWGLDGLISDRDSSGSEFALNDDEGNSRTWLDAIGGLTFQQVNDALGYGLIGGVPRYYGYRSRLGARLEPESGQYFTGRTYYTPNTGSYLQPPNPGGSYSIGNSDDSDPELDAILSTGRWGGLYGSYGRKGYSDLHQMPQWQPGSRDRQQISAMLSALPVIGWVKAGIEAMTGRDYVAGTCLSVGQRLLASTAIISSALKGANAASNEIRALRTVQSVGTESRLINAISAPTRRGGLRTAMLQESGGAAPFANAQAHHELVWTFRDRFAQVGLNVNDPRFGRWVGNTHQQWSHEYEALWIEFFDAHPVGYTQAQVLEYLEFLRSNPRFW
jgi:YD repeat-containing protein